jgi:dTDP-4-amino-4,6-dideoxygalactose transaminase
MTLFGAVPRRCVNLPPGSFKTLAKCALAERVIEGPAIDAFYLKFSRWLGVPHVLGASSGRTAFQLALEALDLKPGAEIIFPVFTFPVVPMVAKLYGYKPVFCDVDPETFNAGPEHVAAKISADTGAVLATHLFGRPCAIEEIVALARNHGAAVIEDCAHACGVRVGGRPVGTFGDIGVFSFAEGKNMPCFGGGAIATRDDRIAERARRVLSSAAPPPTGEALQKAVSIWVKRVLTHPTVFGLTAYPLLRLKELRGQALMDSEVGDELLQRFAASGPRVVPMINLQAAIGLAQLERIEAFNAGARRNAQALTAALGTLPGLKAPQGAEQSHIYVYYPLTIDAARRDSLRRHLLRHRIDSKVTDMSDCARLETFRDAQHAPSPAGQTLDASLLEICVYPQIPHSEMERIARVIRAWARRQER